MFKHWKIQSKLETKRVKDFKAISIKLRSSENIFKVQHFTAYLHSIDWKQNVENGRQTFSQSVSNFFKVMKIINDL